MKPTSCRCTAGALLLVALAACRSGDIASLEDSPRPWLAVLAEEALDARPGLDGIHYRMGRLEPGSSH